MLYIKGVKYQQQMELPNLLRNPEANFEYYCADGPGMAWLDTEFSRRVITTIDRVDVMDSSRPTRDILFDNMLRPVELCTGTKNLILCRYFESKKRPIMYNRLGLMGENCFKFLIQASLERDIRMVTTIFREYPAKDPFPEGGTVYFEDLNVTACSGREWSDSMIDMDCLGLLE